MVFDKHERKQEKWKEERGSNRYGGSGGAEGKGVGGKKSRRIPTIV